MDVPKWWWSKKRKQAALVAYALEKGVQLKACRDCRFRKGYNNSGHELCEKPVIENVIFDNVSGKIVIERYGEPFACSDYRSGRYNSSCGENGIYWEPRTKEQRRKAFVKVWTARLILLAVVLAVAYEMWSLIYHALV